MNDLSFRQKRWISPRSCTPWPTRRACAWWLRSDGQAELSCAALGQQAGIAIAKSTTTHHLGVLRDAGLITTRHEGQRKLATLRRSELDSRFPGLLDAVIAGITSKELRNDV